MYKLLKSGHLILIFLIFCFFIAIIYYNNYYFNNIFHIDLILPSAVIIITICIINTFKSSSNNKTIIKSICILLLLIIIAFSLILLFKPKYSVNSAIDAINKDSEITSVKWDGTMNILPRPNIFISNGYVFSGILESQRVTIIFNPITGEYDVQKE